MSTPRTRVGLTAASWLFLALAGVVVGVVLGLLLDPLARWAAAQEWLPGEGLLDLLDRGATASPGWAQGLVVGTAGLLAGLVLGSRATVVEVSDDDMVVTDGSDRQRFARSQVGTAVLERRRLSVRDHADVDLVSTQVDGDPGQLRDALVEHGWSVRD